MALRDDLVRLGLPDYMAQELGNCAALSADNFGGIKGYSTATGVVPINPYGSGGFTTILLGDSITANGAQTQPTFASFDDRCFFEWANMLSGHNWRVLRNAGIAGQTSLQILARVQSDVIAYGPSACDVMAGTNDFTNGIPASQTIANLAQIYSQLRSAGIYVRAWAITPRPALSAAFQASILTINKWIKEFCAAEPGCEFLDAFAALVSPSSTTQAMIATYTDGALHPYNAGAFAIGQALAPQFSRWPLIASLYPSSASDDLSVNNAAPNVSANPLMLGSGGTFTGAGSAGGSGTVPSQWTVVIPSGWTVVASTPARADGFGNDLQVVITATGAGTLNLQSLWQSWSGTNAGGLALGDSYSVVGEYNMTSPVNVGQLSLGMTSNGQPTNSPVNLGGNMQPLPQAATTQKYSIVTPVVTISSGSTYLLQGTIKFTAAGSATIRLGRAAAYRYPAQQV